MADSKVETKTVTRAFELPVQAIEMAGGGDGWELLRECWREATWIANWAVQQLLRADTATTPVMEPSEFPDPPQVDLYAMAFGRAAPRKRRKGAKDQTPLPAVAAQYPGSFWQGAKISASTIFQKVAKKYRSERWDYFRRCGRGPSFYRHPYPWPVHSQGWKDCGFDDSGRPWVLLSLPGGIVRLRLRGGSEFGRQMALFRQVVNGNLPKRALEIHQQGSSNGCHRPTMTASGRPSRVMLKMVADVPCQERLGNRTLVLLTDPVAFWVAELDERRAWVLNADHVRRTVARHAEHLCRLQRMSEDAKAERRMTGHRDSKQLARLERLAHKDRNRLASFTHEAAAQLVGFAGRQKVGEVFYLDRDRGFMPRFPWHELHQKLADKCAANGIDFCSESSLSPPVDDSNGNTGGNGDVDIQSTPEDQACLNQIASRVTALRRLLAARRRTGSHPRVSIPCGTSTT